MAEGTTLHNLLQSQMSEGKIGPKEVGARKASNFIVKTNIKFPDPGSDGASVSRSSNSIKGARIEDNIMKLKK